jgi:hypothetical protein
MQKKDNEGATAETIEKFAIYPKYVSNMLLQVALEKKDLVAFGESFAELRSSCGKLFPTQGLADAILAMSRFDSSKDVALEVDFLPVAARTRLVESKLYGAFMGNIFEAHLESIKADRQSSGPQRLKAGVKLLTQKPEHDELLFAKAILGSLPNETEQLKFLLGNPEKHFAWLQDAQLSKYMWV